MVNRSFADEKMNTGVYDKALGAHCLLQCV